MDDSSSGITIPAPQTDTLTSIYGAALSSDIWNEVIDRCAGETAACGGAFITCEATESPSYFINAIGEMTRNKAQQHPQLLEEYFADIAPLEMIAQAHMRKFSPCKIWHQQESWPDSATIEAQKHAQWFERHLNVGGMLAANLNDNPRIHETFILHYQHDQHLPSSAIATFKGLLPHLAKSAEMSVVYNKLQLRYSAILTVLNKVGIGLCVLDSTGHVLVKNTEAVRMLEAGHGIKLSGDNQLACNTPENHAQLLNAISVANLNHEMTRAESLMAIRRTTTSDPLLVEISPLRDALDELNFGFDGVLVQLVDTGSRSHCSTGAFSIAYGLTEAEQAVTEHLIDGLSNREIADERGTTMETVKTQIAHIMQKTKSRSRVELVRCVLKTLPPIDIN